MKRKNAPDTEPANQTVTPDGEVLNAKSETAVSDTEKGQESDPDLEELNLAPPQKEAQKERP